MIRKAAVINILAGAIAGAWMVMPALSHAGRRGSLCHQVDVGSGSATQSLALPVGRSAVIELPVDARDVLVSNPTVATAVLRTPRRIYVMGLKSGATDAMFFDGSGRRLLSLSIRVDQNTFALADTINRVLPGSLVKVEAINDSVILSGTVMSAGDADKVVQIAKATVEKPEQVLNMLSIAGKEQVMLKVRIVEMQRSVIKQLGVNWQAVVNQAGNPQFVLNQAATFGVNGAILGGITAGLRSGGNNQVLGDVQAFEREGLVRTLAEPNLTAVSGEAAKFLVGGEFPVPVAEDTTGRVTVEFKTYGIRARLRADRALVGQHFAEAQHRGVRTQQPGRLQPAIGRRRPQPRAARPHRAARRNDGRDALRQQPDDRGAAAGQVVGEPRRPARHQGSADPWRPLPLP